MINCQNKYDLSLNTAFTKVALAVFTMIIVIGAMTAPTKAQQDAPINLLNIAPVNANSPSPRSPNNIDQAVEQTLKVDDGSTVERRDKQQNEKSAEEWKTGELTANAREKDRSTLPLSNRDKAESEITVDSLVTQNPGTERAENVNRIAPIDASGVSTNLSTSSAYGSAKIGRRKISDVGLAAIGVGDIGNDQLDSLIWRGTSARDAIFLLQQATVGGQSRAITRLAYEVVARHSVPPSGANNVATDLVEARLAFLARGGRSSDLALLVAQLPYAEKWASWRRWLTAHYLMIRDDGAACDIVSREITQTLEPFWHKSNVICQAVQGNLDGARFAADILAANGVDDPTFFGLVDEVLNNKPAQVADAASLNPAHIVLMDVANRAIPLEGLSVLPNQMAETVMKLKFLGPDARMVSTFDGLNRGLISHRQAGKLWRNAGKSNDDPQIALARLDGKGDALTTAMAWRAVDADKRPERLSLVPRAVKAAIVAGNGAIMVPLYAELVRNALADEAVASTMRFDDLDVAPSLAFMLAISQPNDTTTLSAFGGNADALQVAEFLSGIERGVIDLEVVSSLKLWQLMPVLDAAGVGMDETDWLDLLKQELGSQQSFVSLSPILLKAITSSAKNGRVAETVLLINRVLHGVTLDQANPSDLASVVAALVQVGQLKTAKAFAQEVVKAHLMQRLVERVPNGTQS